jgi:hypothetical protein
LSTWTARDWSMFSAFALAIGIFKVVGDTTGPGPWFTMCAVSFVVACVKGMRSN